ncbi:substrate-binding periplasmic protein [Roseibium hamelinense]|uniref:substrate-binding periplasmic protein n=1 Tax=Roseibium hamelinense TaxID=150831 RepID=UPI001478B360|nr:transporter substrate-binding domain-containing protein [Roseibium hamelinense]
MLFFTLLGQAVSQPLQIVSEDLPPYNYSKSGIASGVSTEVVTAVMEAAGLSAPIRFQPWARSYHLALSRPNTLIFSIARTPERENQFIWIGQIAPYGSSLFKRSSDRSVQVDTLDDARAYQIGVYLSDVKHQYLLSEGFTRLEPVDHDLLNIRKLAKGRIDLVASDDAFFSYIIRQEGFEPADFERVLKLPGLGGQLYMAMSLGSDPDVVQALTQGLDALKASGRHREILMSHGLNAEDE